MSNQCLMLFFFSDASRASVSRLNPRLTICHCISSSHWTVHSFLRAQTITRENPINDMITVCKEIIILLAITHLLTSYHLIKLVDSSIRQSTQLSTHRNSRRNADEWILEKLISKCKPQKTALHACTRVLQSVRLQIIVRIKSFIEVITTCFVG